LQVDDGRLRLRRQVVADLGDLGLDLGKGSVGIVVQLQVYGDRTQALSAGRLHVVDPVSAGDHALERSRDEASYQVSVGADVRRRDLDDCDVAARILTHAQRSDRLQPGNQDHQIDDDCKDRPFDKQISEFHRLPSVLAHPLLYPRLAVRGIGSRTIRRLHLVVDLDGCAVTELEDTRRDNFIARIDAGENGYLISARTANLDELLPHAAIRLPLLVFHIGDDIHRIAIRGVTDSRSRQFDGGTAAAEVETHLDEHTRTQPVALVGQGRLDLHVASVLVNERVNSRDVTVENVAGQFGGADPHRATVLNLRPLLLGNTEIDVNGVKRLQGHDGRACRQVLAKIHLTNPEDAGKWRTNRLALNRCPQLGDISLGLSLVGTGLVIIRLRD